ncbi:hypothetical protein SAMN05421784_10642 [Xenorhabdus koppenhoeferi]|uniref:Uncharacterized protein n=1 Tax=Xenorhabdus koppenhoeferi TaxID=351659 RepID=A0A1I7G0F7_9GAMM|nr:hypothetical protein SAMN05421784_10642 [Xenorhabdus koppenhoeferi]
MSARVTETGSQVVILSCQTFHSPNISYYFLVKEIQ